MPSLLSLSLGGCMASGQVHSSASISAPDLVYIGPDVQVIADYDEPIFYNSSYYWRYDGGVWYRSSNYRSGWLRVQVAPAAIMQIDRPTAYVHYHAQAAASTQSPAPRDHDQRDEAHERRDERQEVKAEQKEMKAEQGHGQGDEHKAKKGH